MDGGGKDGWMDDSRIDGWRLEGWMDGCRKGDRWVHGRVDRVSMTQWKDEWMNG